MPVCTNCHRDAPNGALFCAFCGSSITSVTDPGEPADPLVGLTVGGKYHIQQLLGRGGMGDVYKATHLTLDRPVVLKLLKKVYQSDQSVVHRFHREARAASRLNHPNSITIIDFGQTDDGTLFIAMEYLAGRSLDQVIAEEHPLAEDRVVHIGAQILAALSEAHALGIIHRDLKPANVMIESRLDENDFVKVLDFGIAKLSEGGTGVTGVTQAGIVCGTPGYMSPEQARGKELDARSDLYAVGVILYEMITGLLPFASLTPMGLVTSHIVEDPTPIRVRNPRASVSPQLETLIMRALARSREERFPNSGEMRAALLSCAAGAGQSVGSTPRRSPTLLFDPAQQRGGEAAKPEHRSGAREIPLADVSKAGAARKPTAETPGVSNGSQDDVAQHAPSSAVARGTPVFRSDAVLPSRRRAPIIVGVIALVIAVVASWGLAGGRFRMQAKSAEAPSRAEPDPGVAVQRNDASPTVVPVSAQVPPGAQAKQPEAAAVAREKGPAVRPPAFAPAPGPTPHPSALRDVKPKKGMKQVRARVNSIPTPSVSSGEGVLTVMASPWAIVSIDDRNIGETPREVRLGAGKYLVRATHPALGARERVVLVKPGKRQIWNPSFGK